LIDNYIKILANQFFSFTGEQDNSFTPGFAAGGFSRLHFISSQLERASQN
jgi:hypothetical protein